jgi:RimJ/RimL family protein N-acetyltransferase
LIRLRPTTRADLPVLFEHQADPVANQLASVPARDEEAFAAHWERLLADGRVRKLVIEVDGEIAGQVLVFDRDGRRELGYWLGRRFWSRGIASAAVTEALRQERSRPLHAGVVEDNLASLRVLEKHGFVRCGQTPFVDPASGAFRRGVLLRLDR